MAIEKYKSEFQKWDQKLTTLNLNELRVNLKLIATGLEDISLAAVQSDYKDVQANGYRSFVKFCLHFCQLLDDTLGHTKYDNDKLLAISRLIVKMTHFINEIRLKSMQDQSKYLTNNSNIGHFSFEASILQFMAANRDDLVILHGKYIGFWLRRPVRRIWKIFVGIWAFCYRPLSIIWRRDKQIIDALNLIIHGTLQNPFKRLDTLGLPTLSFVDMFMWHSSVRCRRVKANIASEFVLDEVNFNLRKMNSGHNRRENSCLIYTKPGTTNSSNQNILYHIHGGGFLTGSTLADKLLYLKDICDKLDGSTIVAVDYTLAKKFPAAIQDVLDTYLWLMADNQAEDLIGFKPKNVVFCGDSAGGNLAVALMILLNDIKTIYGLNESLFPKCIVSVYGWLLCSPLMSPSRVLSLVDCTLPLNLLLVMIKEYAGIPDTHPLVETKYSTGFLTKITTWFQSVFSCSSKERNLPWYLKSEESAKLFLKLTMDIGSCPYASPPLYKHFDQIQVPLVIVTSHYCYFLDDSVALAKVWKGPVKWHLFDEVAHGFLHFGLNEEEKMKYATILKNALNGNIDND